ncbi:MAG: glycosyltransferase family 2 protein [Chromatiales bacterium]|nr:glycosyltransferase family 2 protein [Chromatiales bacterium]
MKFSVIIPVRNNRSELKELLETIEQQSYTEPFETIIVDQSDIKGEPLKVTRGPCQWFRMEGTGVARSRNLAFNHANGDYLVWADSDMRFKTDTLSNVDKITNDYPQYDAICGACINLEDGKPYLRYSYNQPQRINFDNYHCCLGVMVVKRSILSEVGLLDECLGTGGRYGGSEETDWVLRMLGHGCQLLYHPEHAVLHPRLDADKMQLREWVRRHYTYGMGRGAMLRKHSRIKPIWAIKHSLLALIKPAAGILIEILRLRGKQALRYAASIVGRLHGFLSYKP